MMTTPRARTGGRLVPTDQPGSSEPSGWRSPSDDVEEERKGPFDAGDLADRELGLVALGARDVLPGEAVVHTLPDLDSVGRQSEVLGDHRRAGRRVVGEVLVAELQRGERSPFAQILELAAERGDRVIEHAEF